MKKQLGPSTMIFPVPAALIVSGTTDHPNIMTLAWIGMASADPPTVSISIGANHYTVEKIRQYGEFTVNIPSADAFVEVDYCGLVSGKSRKKFEDTGFTAVGSSKINSPIIKECPYNMECKVSQEIVLGGCILFLGEILETHIDNDKLDISQRKKIDISKVQPLVYCGTIREYWSLGEKIGDAYSAGRALMEKGKK